MPAVNTDFTLPRDAYATFDALTIKQHIKDRLTQDGTFTDQDFEGSNLSAIIDIIAFSYHMSLFYLNQTAAESLFDEATIFENINRITKLIGYKPTGYKASILSFEASADENLLRDIYTIKRFSYFTINGISYSFLNDTTFSKTVLGTESLDTLSNNNILYQGKFFEHPAQVAVGEDFETSTLIVKDTINDTAINIEHDSIDVFVKQFNSDKYIEFDETDSLFNENSSSYTFEKRLNENGFYEIKFGNGVNGVKLSAGDEIYIYYLKCDGVAGTVGPDTLNGNNINLFTSTQFETISEFIYDTNATFLTPKQASAVSFTNSNGSTTAAPIETVDQIKVNAPKTFFAQNRIVTNDDLQAFILKNYYSIVSSSILASNDVYIDNVVRYYYDLGLTRPNDDSRVLFNQTKFATTAQMNHAHLYMVPRIKAVDDDNNLFFLTQSQKAEIVNSLDDQKMINVEIIPQDPVYVGITVALEELGNTPDLEDIDDTYLVIQRSQNDRISIDKIKDLVTNIFIEYFDQSNVGLGHTVEVNSLTTDILAIPGVQYIKTRKIGADGNTLREVPSINLFNFNPVYIADMTSSSSSITLPFFKFPFLYNGTIRDKIIVETI